MSRFTRSPLCPWRPTFQGRARCAGCRHPSRRRLSGSLALKRFSPNGWAGLETIVSRVAPISHVTKAGPACGAARRRSWPRRDAINSAPFFKSHVSRSPHRLAHARLSTGSHWQARRRSSAASFRCACRAGRNGSPRSRMSGRAYRSGLRARRLAQCPCERMAWRPRNTSAFGAIDVSPPSSPGDPARYEPHPGQPECAAIRWLGRLSEQSA